MSQYLRPNKTLHRPEPGQPKYCSDCKELLPLTEFGNKKRAFDKLQSSCRKCQKARRTLIITRIRREHREYYARIKLETLTAYGRRCACCEEERIQFLCIDHINGRGNEERRATNTKGGTKFYLLLRRRGFPGGYQVLCYNCNMATSLGRTCPHTKEA